MQVRAAPLPADILIIEGFAPPERETADMPLIGEHTEQTVNGGRTDRRRAGEFPREFPRRELLCGVRREVPDERLFLFRLIRHTVPLPAPIGARNLRFSGFVSRGSFLCIRFFTSVYPAVGGENQSGSTRKFENDSQFHPAMIARAGAFVKPFAKTPAALSFFVSPRPPVWLSARDCQTISRQTAARIIPRGLAPHRKALW